MAFPTYFSNFPEVDYAFQMNKAGKKTSVKFKDFFRLMKLSEELRSYRDLTIYVPYSIKDYETPDQISYDTYGDEQFYWVILQINDIIDYYNQWPLSNLELEEYAKNKYGSVSGYNQVHHYETVSTYDAENNLILNGGLVVDSDFVYTYPSTPGSTVYLSSLPTSVSNFAYEMDLNDKKREISILDPKYVFDYAREVRKAMVNYPDTESQIDISEIY